MIEGSAGRRQQPAPATAAHLEASQVSAGQSVATNWTSCELEEHIEEVRARNDELARTLAERPFDGYVLETVYLLSAAVTEMLDHCGGLHEPHVLVRTMES